MKQHRVAGGRAFGDAPELVRPPNGSARRRTSSGASLRLRRRPPGASPPRTCRQTGAMIRPTTGGGMTLFTLVRGNLLRNKLRSVLTVAAVALPLTLFLLITA